MIKNTKKEKKMFGEFVLANQVQIFQNLCLCEIDFYDNEKKLYLWLSEAKGKKCSKNKS